MVEHRRQRERDGSNDGRAKAKKDAEEDSGFERDVGAEKVRHRHTKVDAETEGDADEGEQAQGLSGVAIFAEHEPLKGAGSRQGCSDGRGHTQLDEQGDEDKAWFEHVFRVQATGQDGTANKQLESRSWTRESEAGDHSAGPKAWVCGGVSWTSIIRNMAIDSVRKVADADFPTRWGQFRILG